MHKIKEEFDFLVPYVGNPNERKDVPRQCPKKFAKEINTSPEYPMGTPIEWRPNKPFKAGLKFSHLYSSDNTSACHVVMKHTESGKRYVMREDDFVNLINTVPAIEGVFVGTWIFRKKGRYISVALA